MSSRRPNAGGGRRNQPRSNVATRARFSTWKPPSKNVTKRFESKRDEKRPNQDRDSTMVIAEARQTSYGGQRFEDIERLELPKEILLRLARALEDTAPPAAPARGDSSIGQVKPIQHKQSVQEDGAAGPQPAGDAAQSSGHAERSSINDTLLAKFLSIGFTETEIGAVSMMGLCCKRRYNHDEDSFTINLVRIVCGMEPLELNSGSGIKPGSASAAADSESLANEIEALGSIYDGLEVSDTVHLFAVPCKVLLVTLMNDDGPTIIKLIYYNSAEYLTEGSASRVYGWIVESPLAPKLARDVSAYGNLLLQRADAGLGTGFDFVLHVQSGRVENSGTDLIPTAVSAVPKKESGKKDKPAGSREVSVKNAGLPPPDRFPSGVPRKPLELPSIDLLLNLKLPEYRQALMLAMNAGLSGQAAREKARADLEYVLPSSTIAAIREEEVTLDLIRERAFKLSTFGTRGEIICCKVLGKETDLSKPKCKAWLQKARESLEATDEAHARDENAMTIKWVEEALRLLGQREKVVLEKKKVKLEEKERPAGDKPLSIDQVITKSIANIDVNGDSRRREKGPTIRASYELAAQAVDTGIIPPEPMTEVYKNEYSDFLKSVDCDEGPVEAVFCSLLDDPDINKRLSDDLNAKRRLPKYTGILAARERLPAFKMRDTVVAGIAAHRVTVISGDTGCGKTTQVPQMVLDDFVDRGKGSICNIIVTQPRRISAISVAERIAQERAERVGQTAGYSIRLENKRSENTKILLITTGILIRRLLVDNTLSDVTHIFVDEVHERDINTDFLLIVLRKLLDMRPDLKVVLMSATLNAKLFESYFKSYGSIAIHIPGRTYPVASYYLEDALEHTGFTVESTSNPDILQKSSGKGRGKAKTTELSSQLYCGLLTEQDYMRQRMVSVNNMRSQQKYSSSVLSTLEMLDESAVNVELICALVLRIVSRDPHGAILIFVPGFSDIKTIIENLASEPIAEIMNVLPLHSSLSSHEQNKVFQIPKKGIWKVVVSTNIAETSITIEDVLYVIDTCRTKENRYDEINQISVLEDTWASRANAGQRRGRAGRVRSGTCYHLISTFTFTALRDYAVPEMLRLGLEELVLQILALDLGDPFRFLLSAVSPPTLVSIRHALTYLDSIGAVTLGDGEIPVSDPTGGALEDQYVPSCISPLGYHLATLPVNARIGKLMLYGVLLRCVDPILTIAAFSSVKSPFVSSFDSRDESDAARKEFLTGDSDLLTMLNAYNSWAEIVSQPGGGSRAAEIYCSRHYLSSMSLKQIQQIRGQFIELLRDIGFIGPDVKISNVKSSIENTNGGDNTYIKCALCAGMAPNIAIALGSGKKAPVNGSSNVVAKKKMCESVFTCSAQGSIYLHPSSVLSDIAISSIANSYYMYLDAVRTSKVFARDLNRVDPATLALFGGKMRILHGGKLLQISGWVYVRADQQLVQCVQFLRDLMDRVFLEKVLCPQMKDTENPHVQQMHACLRFFFPSL